MNKSLTLVIPTYNMERYLERCLNSLIISSELMDELEVLVINDGSKDRSSEIGHSFETKYPETFRVIDKDNGNYGSCVNRGLKEARGKYIKILDADDWFDTENFAEFVKLLGTLDVDLVITDMVQVDENGMTSAKWNYSLPKEKKFTLEQLTRLSDSELIWMHCVSFKTENLRSINYKQSEGISYTDQEWIFLPIASCKTLYYYPITVYKYLVGRDGQTMNPEIFKKNFWMEIKGTIRMIHQLSHHVHCDDEAYSYLRKRLLGRAMVCYGNFLEKYKMDTCQKEMIELDNVFKEELPSLYHELDSLKRINPLKKHHSYEMRFPRFWVILVWLWRKERLPVSSKFILFWVRLKEIL